MQAIQLIPPVVPLKNISEWLTGNPNSIRDSPLVPKGTVLDIYIYIYTYIEREREGER